MNLQKQARARSRKTVIYQRFWTLSKDREKLLKNFKRANDNQIYLLKMNQREKRMPETHQKAIGEIQVRDDCGLKC